MIWKSEPQTAYLMDALRLMRERNLSSFEVRPDAQDRYMRWFGKDLDNTVWARGAAGAGTSTTAAGPASCGRARCGASAACCAASMPSTTC
jgi:hypothetical protein